MFTETIAQNSKVKDPSTVIDQDDAKKFLIDCFRSGAVKLAEKGGLSQLVFISTDFNYDAKRWCLAGLEAMTNHPQNGSRGLDLVPTTKRIELTQLGVWANRTILAEISKAGIDENNVKTDFESISVLSR